MSNRWLSVQAGLYFALFLCSDIRASLHLSPARHIYLRFERNPPRSVHPLTSGKDASGAYRPSNVKLSMSLTDELQVTFAQECALCLKPSIAYWGVDVTAVFTVKSPSHCFCLLHVYRHSEVNAKQASGVFNPPIRSWIFFFLPPSFHIPYSWEFVLRSEAFEAIFDLLNLLLK